MVHNIVRGIIYFVVFVAIQVLLLNNIHFLRIATPFLYLYFLIKIPLGTTRVKITVLSFLTGLVIDAFSNTPGMHAAACTFIGFFREPLINFLIGKELQEGSYPSYKTFGYGGFFRYVLFSALIHHIILYLIESLSLFDPLFLTLRILASTAVTTILICAVEAFNLEAQKSGE